MITVGSLFAGVLGFDLGFERAGMKTIWVCEKDASCQGVIRVHLPGVEIYGDITTVNGSLLTRPDIVCFGSPCQDLSMSGKREGLAGERSVLFYEGIRIIGECKPSIAIWENVPGAFSSNDGRDFTAVIRAFQELGACDIAWRVLNAQYFGVPQRRRRIILVADFAGERAAEILFERVGLQRRVKASQEKRQEVAGTLGSHSSGGFGGSIDVSGAFIPDVTNALTTGFGTGGGGRQ